MGLPKGKPLSVMVITEERICPCQPMSHRTVAANASQHKKGLTQCHH